MTTENSYIEVFPVGSAESAWVTTPRSNELIILDYADTKTDEPNDRRIDLKQELIDRIGEGGTVRILSLSHADKDHIQGSPEVFYLEHAAKYQDKDRVRIETLCVPARFITESRNDMSSDAKIMQAEARHRLKEGKGIVVVSEPGGLDKWLENQDIDPKDRQKCIATAGKLLPHVSLEKDGVEIFVHSPFSYQGDSGERQDRNDASIVLHLTIDDGKGNAEKLLFMADVGCDVIKDIVLATERHGNEERLEHTAMVVSHHGSRNSLKPQKDDDVDPVVDRLFREYGEEGATYVISSRVMPAKDDGQPPHKDAVAYYKEVAKGHSGEVIITMEHPTKSNPKPVQIGKKRKRPGSSSSSSTTSGTSGAGGAGASGSMFPPREEAPGFG